MSCAKTPEGAERERVYQEGQRAFGLGLDCPYTCWRAMTWKKGHAAAKEFNNEILLLTEKIEFKPDSDMPTERIEYLIGQRVILNGCSIGVIVKAERSTAPNTQENLWVHCPRKGYASYYDVSNIKPLPNGQM